MARQSRSATVTKIRLADDVAGEDRERLERVDDPQVDVKAQPEDGDHHDPEPAPK